MNWVRLMSGWNNAMTTIFAPFLEITPEEFKRATEVTYLGQVNGTLSALKRMYAAESGLDCPGRARHWPTARFLCNRRTAGPSTPSLASRTPSGRS